jgi:hypothetical protein
MSVDDSMNETLNALTLSDVKPATEKDVVGLEHYIKNAAPLDEFNMDAQTLKSLLNLIRKKEKQEVLIASPILHEDTKTVVINATNSVLSKLAKAQVKYNLHDGWRHAPKGSEDDGRYFVSEQGCVNALFNHLAKGDVIDSIAYLAYLNELSGGDKVTLIADQFTNVASNRRNFSNQQNTTTNTSEIWVESDMIGNYHVMVKHAVKLPVFNYCSFFYVPFSTDNATIKTAAENMARALGAKDPILIKPHELDVITAFRKQHAKQQQ